MSSLLIALTYRNWPRWVRILLMPALVPVVLTLLVLSGLLVIVANLARVLPWTIRYIGHGPAPWGAYRRYPRCAVCVGDCAQHPATHLTFPDGQGVCVDVEVAALCLYLWEIGLPTTNSCQDQCADDGCPDPDAHLRWAWVALLGSPTTVRETLRRHLPEPVVAQLRTEDSTGDDRVPSTQLYLPRDLVGPVRAALATATGLELPDVPGRICGPDPIYSVGTAAKQVLSGACDELGITVTALAEFPRRHPWSHNIRMSPLVWRWVCRPPVLLSGWVSSWERPGTETQWRATLGPAPDGLSCWCVHWFAGYNLPAELDQTA